jgi:hypothetical protein
MINLAADISLYTSTSINEALELPVSVATRIFESKSFENWKKGREGEIKIQSAIINRLDGVIKSVGILIKSGRRF